MKSEKQEPIDDDEIEVLSEFKTSKLLKKQPNKIKKLWAKYKEKKKLTIPLTILVVILIVMAIPFTRYKILGLFIKRTITINVYDSQNGKPVSQATVEIGNKQSTTDGNGMAVIDTVKVGNTKVKISKKYYKETNSNYLVSVKGPNKFDAKIEAVGRQVPVSVSNSIDGKLIKGATIKSGDSDATTDDNGNAILVLNPELEKVETEILADGYNSKKVQITVTDEVIEENKFSLTTKGKIYFLSKKSGKVDVISTNLDGTDRQTVLAGTGNEDYTATTLIASRDWRYLALFAKRDGSPKLYLINTLDNSFSTIEDQETSIYPVGWYDQYFVYYLINNDKKVWQPKYQALKSFDADRNEKLTLDETQAEGNSDIDYTAEQYTNVNILANEIVYSKVWYADPYSGGRILGKKSSINSISPSGIDRRVIQDFVIEIGSNSYISSTKYKPQILYFEESNFTQNRYYEYQNTKLTEKPQIGVNSLMVAYPNYLLSPSSIKTLWYESRDGKNVIFVGDRNTDNSRQLINQSEYITIGWFTDEYILLSKNGSELYIASPDSIDKAIKISDFQPNDYSEIGGGYSYIVK